MPDSTGREGRTESIYIVWKKFQRRVESLAPEFEASATYYHFRWEELSPFHKLASYGVKFVKTLRDLLRQRPTRVFVQLAPTPALYAVAIYAFISGAEYIADCHNSMIYGSWRRWPFARYLLHNCKQILAHNKDVAEEAEKLQLHPFILRDPLPMIELPSPEAYLLRLGLEMQSYVIVPGNLAQDEPIEEILYAARQFPDFPFVFTWFAERLPRKVRAAAPSNVMFSGYLTPEAFNAVFANAAAAVVLTTREGTQPSGAAEALALEVPVVLSDLQTTRRIYRRAAVYVSNNGPSIAAGIDLAIRERITMQHHMEELRASIITEVRTQILCLKETLGIRTEITHLDYMRDILSEVGSSADYGIG